MARNRTAGAIRCPWCPRQFWIERRHGKRATGVALQAFGRHAEKAHKASLEQAYASLREIAEQPRLRPDERARARGGWLGRVLAAVRQRIARLRRGWRA